MKAIMIILILALAGSILVNILTINEAKDISKSLEFLAKNKSQMRIETSFRIKAFKNLSQNINNFLDSFHQKEKTYILNEKNLQATITGLSHDIRTPLTSLDGYLQLLSKVDNPEDKEKYLNIMSNRIKSLNKILDQLFTFVKLQEEEYRLDIEEVNLKKLGTETLLSFYEDFVKKDMEPRVDFPEKDIFIKANKDALERIFQNIYKNILEHGENPLVLSLKETENQVIFMASNKIRPNEKISEENLFKEFYKGDKSRNSSSTGLGLSITKGLVKKLGGSIAAKVKEDSFILTIVFNK